MQRLKGFKSLHNLFDKGVVFFDFWKFLSRFIPVGMGERNDDTFLAFKDELLVVNDS